jgi:hypothetical protein
VHGTPTLNTIYWTEDRSDEFCLRMAAQAGLEAGDVIAFGTPTSRGTAMESGHVEVDIRRVEYDLDRAMAGVRASELPDECPNSSGREGSLRPRPPLRTEHAAGPCGRRLRDRHPPPVA